MIAQIDHFKRVDIGMGLSEFQTVDMHRHRPFTMRSRARGRAVTKIRPHSLFEMERSAYQLKRLLRYRRTLATRAYTKRPRKYRRRHTTQRFYKHYSMRPILREEMYSVLADRMTRLLDEKITWKSSKEK
jgi:hypothetical protein